MEGHSFTKAADLFLESCVVQAVAQTYVTSIDSFQTWSPSARIQPLAVHPTLQLGGEGISTSLIREPLARVFTGGKVRDRRPTRCRKDSSHPESYSFLGMFSLACHKSTLDVSLAGFRQFSVSQLAGTFRVARSPSSCNFCHFA